MAFWTRRAKDPAQEAWKVKPWWLRVLGWLMRVFLICVALVIVLDQIDRAVMKKRTAALLARAEEILGPAAPLPAPGDPGPPVDPRLAIALHAWGKGRLTWPALPDGVTARQEGTDLTKHFLNQTLRPDTGATAPSVEEMAAILFVPSLDDATANLREGGPAALPDHPAIWDVADPMPIVQAYSGLNRALNARALVAALRGDNDGANEALEAAWTMEESGLSGAAYMPALLSLSGRSDTLGVLRLVAKPSPAWIRRLDGLHHANRAIESYATSSMATSRDLLLDPASLYDRLEAKGVNTAGNMPAREPWYERLNLPGQVWMRHVNGGRLRQAVEMYDVAHNTPRCTLDVADFNAFRDFSKYGFFADMQVEHLAAPLERGRRLDVDLALTRYIVENRTALEAFAAGAGPPPGAKPDWLCPAWTITVAAEAPDGARVTIDAPDVPAETKPKRHPLPRTHVVHAAGLHP